MSKQYKSVLNIMNCRQCQCRNTCFFQSISLSKYPERVQEFLIKSVRNNFSYQKQSGLWCANYWNVEEKLIQYYDIYHYELEGNTKCILTREAQRENDRQEIGRRFKQILDLAAKANENINPEVSIMLDGVGFLLASDYVEAVNKIFSMLKTVIKNDDYFSRKILYGSGFEYQACSR